jgi:acyl-coenzyme A synthetase/AMP-(fatty) acid ligase
VTSERITYTGFSPSYLRLLLASPQVSELLESELEIVALGGEASSLADVRALINVAPKIRIFNRYGPTETTVAVTHLELTPEIISGNTLPIGLPHDDVAFHLVDDSGDVIVDSNRSGELHISGVQLMDEYWNSPELTKEVLRSDIVTGTTVYKTGDIAYRDSNGLYVYVGRADHVVKRSGVRISLVELSESIRRISGVKAAVCLTYDDDDEVGIVAFVVGGNALTAATVRGAMRAQLPENMVPNHIELVHALPMTGSGKVDERRLLRESELGKQLNERSVQSPKQGGS